MKDFNEMMADLDNSTNCKLVVTAGVIPASESDIGEVYVARVEKDDGTTRGVISFESMEVALGKAVAQIMFDDAAAQKKVDEEWEEEEEEDWEENEDEDEDYCGCYLCKKEAEKEKVTSIKSIKALKDAISDMGFDKAVSILEDINNNR